MLFISKNTNPYYNLALEDYFLRKKNMDNILLIWQSSNSVILGKYQNIVDEVDISFCEKNKINIVRRQSGGGCIFSDLGNINFSFIQNKSKFNRCDNLDLIINLLKGLGINLNRNSKFDLILDDKFKVSGSAFKVIKNRSLHHFTLLLDSNLSILKESITSPISQTLSNSIKSNRSLCINLNERAYLDMDIIRSLLLQKFKPITKDIEIDYSYIDSKKELFESIDYIYNNPKFKVKIDKYTIVFNKGVITINGNTNFEQSLLETILKGNEQLKLFFSHALPS